MQLPNMTGIYHDGVWQLGSGPDEVDVPGGPLYWDNGDVHSITLPVNGGTAAIRASRRAGVELDDRVRIGASI